MSSIIKRVFPLSSPSVKDDAKENASISSLISVLHLQPHVEGGYFAETDRDSLKIPNPFDAGSTTSTRNASTSIFYLLTPDSSVGHFHRNKARTIHTLHRGRGRYVIVHADEAAEGQKARVETFVVGQDVANGERLQWIVEGGKYKASFLLPDEANATTSGGLLISEIVVPGFEYSDHDFMLPSQLPSLVTPDQAKELSWLVRQDEEALKVDKEIFGERVR